MEIQSGAGLLSGEKVNEIYKISLGFIIGVAFTLLVFLPFTGARNATIDELENKLVESQRLESKLREHNQILTIGQSIITNDLENAIGTIAELEERNHELKELVERTGRDIARAIVDAESLTQLIERIIESVDDLLTAH